MEIEVGPTEVLMTSQPKRLLIVVLPDILWFDRGAAKKRKQERWSHSQD